MPVIKNTVYEVPQKSKKKKTARLSSNTTPRDIPAGM
jgi:hypothetical protein